MDPARPQTARPTASPGAGALPPRPPRASWLFALRILVTLMVLGAVLRYALGNRGVFGGGWEWHWPWLAAAALLVPLLLGGRSWKWQVLARPLAPGLTFRQAFASYVGALPLGLITPGRLGEYARGMFLPQSGVRGAAGAGRVFVDNWTDFLGVLAWALAGWTALKGWSGLVPGAILLLVFLPMGFWMRVLRAGVERLPAWGLRKALLDGIPSRENLDYRLLLGAAGMGVVLFGLECLQVDALLRLLGAAPPGILELGGLMALVALANSVQITLAGLGVREGLTVYLLAGAGIDAQAALVASTAQFGLNLVLPALGGLFLKPRAPG